jgi:hypothetical protein
MRKFSFFDADSRFEKNILESFQGTELDGEAIQLNLSKPDTHKEKTFGDRTPRFEDRRPSYSRGGDSRGGDRRSGDSRGGDFRGKDRKGSDSKKRNKY